MKSIVTMFLVLFFLSACDESQQLRHKLETSTQSQTQFVDYPTFNPRAYERMRTQRQKDKYVLDKVSQFVQDKMVKNANYSDAFYLKTLGLLPQELQWLYATFYVERESALDGFSGYIKRTKGFLAPQALQGYRLLGQQKQAQWIETLMTSDKPMTLLKDLEDEWPRLSKESQMRRVQFITEHLSDWSTKM